MLLFLPLFGVVLASFGCVSSLFRLFLFSFYGVFLPFLRYFSFPLLTIAHIYCYYYYIPLVDFDIQIPERAQPTSHPLSIYILYDICLYKGGVLFCISECFLNNH